jgi:pimeloyl-ACP methyl ester carboxylesterase
VPTSRIKVDSVEVALCERGQGKPVLAVHGLWSDGAALAAALAALASRFRIIAPDLPGFGQSDKPTGYLFSPDGYAAFLLRLARVLELDRFAAVGAGLGRLVVARARLRDPARVVVAAAVGEPRQAKAALALLASGGQRRATRKLLGTLASGRWDAAAAPTSSPEALRELVAAAFARKEATTAAEQVDEAAERARAEELAALERQRRRLPLIG